MRKLEMSEMENVCGGNKILSVACGAGIALSIFTGGIGALIWGPSTIGVCIAAAKT